MSLVSLIIVLVVIGLVLYLINAYIPMAPPIKTTINVLVIIVLCLWLLSLIGLDIRIPLGSHPR
jgi:hypothetical protein